jgi:peptide/nickel transport system substrate-binding protein
VSDSLSLERLREDVLAGRLSRRSVLKRGVALGLSAPILAGLLAACGGDDDDDDDTDAPAATESGGQADATATTAEAEPTEAEGEAEPTEAETDEEEPTEAAEPEPTEAEAPAEAGGGGLLRLLWWQAPTIINPHLSTGTKDFDASRVCLEPLADFDVDGNMVLVLAAEEPSVEAGTVSEDGTEVTWSLREGVKWHDGEDFTAEDVVFTWEFASNPETAAVTAGNFANVSSVEAVDDYTVTVTFTAPNPAWFDVFTGPNGMILPQHVFADYMGAESRNAPANLQPIGTGPFMVREFRAGDVVLFDRFPDYWDAGKPWFDEIEMKGGGDAQGAARAVLETGEADWGWNIQVEPEIMAQLAQGGAGVVVATPGTSAERVMVNFADPDTEVDGARAEPTTEHPIFKNKDARNAIALAIQRDVIAEQLYGEGGVATANNLNAPAKFVSPNTSWEYDLDAAAALLANVPEADGFNLLFQTSINSVRQKTQEIIKQDLEQLGFSVELKSIDAAVFFSSDAGNPDTYPHFYADLEMYTNGPSSPFPITWAERFRTDEIAEKANSWAGTNITRYNNPEFDKLHDQARTELDPDVQVELFVAMNDLSVNDFVEIPIIHRAGVAVANARLTGQTGTPWASDVYDMKNWRFEE